MIAKEVQFWLHDNPLSFYNDEFFLRKDNNLYKLLPHVHTQLISQQDQSNAEKPKQYQDKILV